MHTLKTITLALMLIIFSITGLRAEEISFQQFIHEVMIALQAENIKKLEQLFIDNPNTTKVFQQMLARAGKDSGYMVEQFGSLPGLIEEFKLISEFVRLQEEGQKAYNRSDYSTALEKWEQGLNLAHQAKKQQTIGVFIVNLGAVYTKFGNYPKALDYYQQALAIYKEIGDKRGIGGSLTNIGWSYNNLGNYPKALDYLQQALAIHKEIGDKRGIGADLSNIGVVYQYLGLYLKAFDYYQQALVIQKEISDKHGIGNNLTNIGNVHQYLGNYQKALDYYQQGLAIHKEFGDKHGIGTDLGSIGMAYQNLGNYSKALDYYQQALKIKKKIGDKHGIGMDLIKIGIMYDKLDLYPKALNYYQQALKIIKEIGDKRGMSTNLNCIGIVYDNLGYYSKALDYYQQSLAIDKEIGNKHGIGVDLTNIGVVYNKLGLYSKALDYYQQSLAIDKEINNKLGIGNDLINIGMVYDDLGNYPKALDYLQQALKIKKKIGDKRGIGMILTNTGVVYNNLGNDIKALDYYQQALAIDKEIGYKRGIRDNLTNIGVEYKNLGKYQKAKNAFQESIAIENRIGVENWRTKRGLASTEAKLNQLEPAIQHYIQALNNIEKTRNLLSKKHKTSFMSDKLYVYDELITLLQSQHLIQAKKAYDHKAFEIFERKQGRLFLEEMGQSGARRFSGLDNKIVEAEQSLIYKWQKLKSKPFTPQEYRVLEQDEIELKKRIKAQYPKYYALKYPQPVDLATLQNQVLQKGEMMLVYGVLHPKIEKKTVLWVISKQDFQMFTLPVDEDTLKQKVAQLRSYLSDSSFNRKFPQASLELYQTLLPKAVHKLIKGAEILYIVPTGPLYGLPFGALVTSYQPRRKINYLIEDYAISYLSSASLLKTLREEKRKIQPPKPFLAFADPEYPPCGVGEQKGRETLAQLRTKSYLKWTKGGCFTRLAATTNEVRQIANLLNADHNKALYLGAKANRSTVLALNDKQQLDDYRYIMFSVHGIIPNKHNQIEQPALVLSNPLTDGYLTMADAFSLKLNADFVNLSACNTGCTANSCSENVRGAGIMGLTRAFMYAGTSRVSVTLWSVDLYSAKDLSVGLFSNLKANKKMAHALREIKLKMIQGKASKRKYANPYHWAAFVVYGDGQ